MINKNKFTTKILLLSVLPILIIFIFLGMLQIKSAYDVSSKTSTELEKALYEIYTDVSKMKSQDIIDKLNFQSSGMNNLVDSVKNERIGDSGFAFLLQSNGDILNISESNARLLQLRKNVPEKEDTQTVFFNFKSSKNKKLRNLADKIKISKEYNIYSIIDDKSEEYLISFQKINKYDLSKSVGESIKNTLYLSLVIPLSDILEVSHEIKRPIMTHFEEHLNSAIVISVIIFLFVLLLSTFFALRETKQIRLINEGIGNIKKRKFSDQIEIVSSDDLGDLAQTFNEMTTEIQKTYQDLEEKVNERTKEIENKNRQLEELVVRDRLTGLYNRTKLDEVLEHEYKLSKRYNSVFGVIMIDIDFFKKVNDTHGHQAGDTILCEFASLIEENSRETDTVGRWGGEEFLIIVENIDKDAILNLAEKLRTCVDEYEFSIVKHKTASFGVSIYEPEDEINKIIARADIALYKAKHNGRNRVEFL